MVAPWFGNKRGAGDVRRRACTVVDHVLHQLPQRRRGLGRHRATEVDGLGPPHDRAIGCTHFLHRLRLDDLAAIGDRGGDLCHLQRGGEQALLADREARNVNGRGSRHEVALPVEDAGRQRLLWRVIPREAPEEPEVLHRRLEIVLPERQTDFRKGGVDRVDEGVAEVVRAVRVPVEVAEVLAAGLDTGRARELLVDGDGLVIERACGRHDFERRSRGIEALCRAVE